MTINRYAVIDAAGTKINTILIDQDLVARGWNPGYGVGLIDEGPEPEEPPRDIKAEAAQWLGVIDIAPAEPMQVGDIIDLDNGGIKKVQPNE